MPTENRSVADLEVCKFDAQFTVNVISKSKNTIDIIIGVFLWKYNESKVTQGG